MSCIWGQMDGARRRGGGGRLLIVVVMMAVLLAAVWRLVTEQLLVVNNVHLALHGHRSECAVDEGLTFEIARRFRCHIAQSDHPIGRPEHIHVNARYPERLFPLFGPLVGQESVELASRTNGPSKRGQQFASCIWMTIGDDERRKIN